MVDDVHAITTIVHAYAELLDAGDVDGIARLLDRATVRAPGASEAHAGAEATRALIADAVQMYDGIPGTRHVVTNLIVQVDDDRAAATARSYYTAFQARPELPLQPILAGRWHDGFARDDEGRWYLAHRTILVDLVGELRHHIVGGDR